MNMLLILMLAISIILINCSEHPWLVELIVDLPRKIRLALFDRKPIKTPRKPASKNMPL